MTTATQTRRGLGRLLAVGALTLVLGGLAANPTAATGVEKIPDYGSRAAFKESCETAVEDEPAGTFTDMGNDGLFCQYPDGEIISCNKDGIDCYSFRPGLTRPPDTHAPVDGGGVIDDGGTDAGTPDVTGPDGHQQPAATPALSHGKAKKHRHGHHGKRH